LAALDRERRVVKKDALADRDLQAVRLDDRPPAARRLEELEAEPARLARQQRDLVGVPCLLLLQAADLRELRLRLHGLVLLRAEPLDEALEARDVVLYARGFLLGVQHPRRLFKPPLVPRAGEERP